MQRPGRDETFFKFGQGLSLGLISSHLLTAGTHTGAQRRAHTRGSSIRLATRGRVRTLSSKLWHCKAYPAIPDA
jgi:hypothetical protein